MPAVNKKQIAPKSALQKLPKTLNAKVKAPKAKLISQLGVTPVLKTSTKHPYNPVKSNRGIVFIKHIPHGFYEDQLKSYFEQFGAVTRTRVARSERSGKSKGYAFVEFRVPEVAQIAAETMNNYLMFKQVLQTAYIAPEEQKYNYFRQTVRTVTEADGTQRLVTPHTSRTDKAVKKMNTMPTKKQHENRVERALYKLKKAQEAYTSKNIDVDLQQVAHGHPVVAADQPARKKLTKKQQKAADEAKRVARAARKTDANTSAAVSDIVDEAVALSPPAAKKAAKRPAANVNTTLDKLINETIGESADDDSEDEDFDLEADSSLDVSSASTASIVSTSSAASATPSPPKGKRAKRIAAAVAKPSTPVASTTTEESDAALSSPEPIVVRSKKFSSLVATGGIQKKRAATNTVTSAAGGAKKKPILSQAVQKSKVIAKELIESTVDAVKPVKAGALKKTKKAKRS